MQPNQAAAQTQREIEAGDELYSRGQYKLALEHYARATRVRPLVGEYHFKRAMAAWRAGQPSEAEEHFREAAGLEPNQPDLHEGLAQWFLAKGDVEAALRHSSVALNLDPQRVAFIVTRANVLASSGEHQAAWELISPLIASGDGGGRLAWVYAQIAPKLGQEAQALAVLERALRAPALGSSLRSALHFAAAGLLDRLGQYDRAFQQAYLANEAGRRPFDPAAHSAWISRQIDYFTPQRLRSLSRATHGSRRPVFIVGMPRSGTSLVEQILASHGDVFGAGELRLLGDVARSLAPVDSSADAAFPRCLESLPPEQIERLGSRYLDGIAGLDATARYVTDKMPLNFLMLGFIELLLPACRVIQCTRDPRDTCLSCYFTDFGLGNEFSFSLSHLASYYRDYQRLMTHWRQALALPMLEIRYEDLVADTEGQIHRMLEFLELPWGPRCLDFHQSRRYVATASREQVHRPIYVSSVGRWTNYRRHITELLSLKDENA